VGSHCLSCVKAATPPAKERLRIKLAFGPPFVTYIAIGLNLATYVLIAASPNLHLSDFSLFGPSIAINGEWFRIVTSAFLHVNLIHIFFNLFVMYQIGPILEQGLGRWRYAGLYLFGLLGGSLGALLLDPNVQTVGASGAVYGLMGALFVLSKRRGLNPWGSGIGTLIAVNLLISVAIPAISLGGHVGGLLAGAAAALLLDPARSGWRNSVAIGVGIIAVGVIVLFSGSLLAAG